MPIVIDPVMVATSGDILLETSAVDCLCEKLLPLATVITPNKDEAELLLQREILTSEALQKAGVDLHERFKCPVLLKGGHLPQSELTDHLVSYGQCYSFSKPKIETRNTHGTGCTYAAGITAFLAQGHDLVSAVEQANTYLQQAIAKGADYVLGQGHGPVCHQL